MKFLNKSLLVMMTFLTLALSKAYAAEIGTRQFFKNSTRRNPNQKEQNLTAKVRGCTAFFVETNNDRVILVSARHCFSHAITNWCNTSGIIKTNDGQTGRCSKIIAASSARDIAFFEATGLKLPNKEDVLRVASFVPPKRARLKMIGYPADKYRRAKLTTTENCWVLLENISSPHDSRKRDRSSKHNCSTYGGNSGGPMYLENTNVAIGLPFTYSPGNYYQYDPEKVSSSAYLAQMADIVAMKRAELEAAGVVIQDEVPAATLYQ